MADETPTAPPAANGQDSQPHAAALLQYIKDLSVESPNSPQCFQWQTQPQVDIQFTINVDKVADDVHEVTLRINVGAKADQGVQFLVDLSYAGLFGIRNFPEEAMGPFFLVEAPRLLFPFARQIIADAQAEADGLLIPVGDPRLAEGTWVVDVGTAGAVSATTVARVGPLPPA